MLTESSFCGSVFTQPHLQRPALEYEQRNQVLVSLQSKSANVFDSITGAASDSERNISLFAVQKSGQLPDLLVPNEIRVLLENIQDGANVIKSVVHVK